jgi:succinate-acetate transporter protein
MSDTARKQSHKEPTAAMPQALDVRDMTRIILRPIGSSIPLGLFTVAIASAVVSAFEVGIIPKAGEQAVALVIAPAFVLQLVASIFAFLSRDAIAATLLASFASTWLVSALAFFITPTGAGQALGVYYFVFTLFILLILSMGKSKIVLTAVMICAVPRFISGGIYEFNNSIMTGYVAGGFGFLLVLVSLYGAYVLLTEDVSGKSRFPTGRSGAARAALQGSITDQLEGIEHTAGVRRTL